ncbi:CAP domain-containing protein [Streptomyces sp. GS7]|uniref:CAP domain-containing protein n=1 Tax=Streptomyces sp. GS7 TaxID=2692234 RepID=UPI001318B928|nr:CAP domain-containing protein [Streptomyces sp. GS7]QHC22942.1 CAP domain-containing protein [Streptomyces sp. GS7]
MTKHRKKRNYRRISLVALAVTAVGVPSIAMACRGGPSDGAAHRHESSASAFRQQPAQGDGSPEPTASPTATSAAPQRPETPKASKTPTAPKRTTEPKAPTTPRALPTAPTFAAPTAAPRAPAAVAAPASGIAARVVQLVNQERAKVGCSPLTLNAKLTNAAEAHSTDMADHSNMSHTGSDGSDPGARITNAGYSWSSYGENVAYGYDTPESVMAGWMSSPGHKRNILDCSFRDIGVGLAQPGSYWTQDFGAAR